MHDIAVPSASHAVKTSRRRLGVSRAFALAIVIALASACTTATPQTEGTLRSFVGKQITEFIETHHAYPDSSDELPSGNRVYRFSRGSGARVDGYGNIISNVCLVWLETNPAGVIVRWRYENCT